MARKLSIVLLAGFALLSVTPVNAAIDDHPSNWARKDVDWMIKEGLVPERLKSEYQSKITREEFAEIADRVMLRITHSNEKLHVVTTEQSFADTNAQYVTSMFAFGVVNGVKEETFEPDRAISRQEAVVLMANMLNTFKVEGLSTKAADFIDKEAIAGWAKTSANICYNANIFQGSKNGMEPYHSYTREQTILTMKRLVDFVKKVDGVSLRGKVFVKFEDIDDMRVGANYVKIGTPKSKMNYEKLMNAIAGNLTSETKEALKSGQPTTVRQERLLFETYGEDFLIKVSW
ncbi:S-layer homology domain-containing protein [Cohnella cholangitidis]|nr:S-layer homology domain-containing protein [Cohnella cholangitidis]